jgi:hypothetical protein
VVVAIIWLALPATSAAQQVSADPRTTDDPFGRRGWHLELGSHAALETWNYNGSHEEMLSGLTGLTYGIGRGVVLKIGSPLYHVWQRGTNGYLFGVSGGARGRVAGGEQWSLFWEAEVGISKADTSVPPRGTRFNYLALGGAGLTVRMRPGLHGLAGLRWVHVSNNSLAGRHRNPDIEAVGPTLGLLIRF